MAILAYEYNSAVSDHHTMLEKIKNFAVAQGWTAQEWSKNSVEWGDTGGGVYGWIAGSESYLRLLSTGYGSQVLQYRFSLPDAGTINSRTLTVGAFIEDEGNDTTNAAHPVGRNALGHANWNTAAKTFSLSSDPCDAWFFGNDKAIIVVIKYDNTYVQSFWFGSPELEDSAETEGNWVGLNSQGATDWYSKNNPCAFDLWYQCCYRDALRGDSDIYPSFVCDAANATGAIGPGSEQGLLHANSYSDARALVRQIIHLKDTADGLLIKNWGYHWAYRIWHRGLQIGETYENIAGEKYICFPWSNLVLTSHNLGFAIRVE